MKKLSRWLVVAALIAQTVLYPSLAAACTGITIKPKDGSVIYARTLEFAVDTASNVIIVPRNTQYVGTSPNSDAGLRWQTKYGFTGANAFGLPVTLDGLNEKGLAVGLFYFPGYAEYQKPGPEAAGKIVAPWELGTYLLGVCANTEEAVAAVKDVCVVPVVQKDMGIVPPVHYIVTDAQGHSVVIEYVGGELKIHENPLGVMTNAPTFDWHMTNLANYVNEAVTSLPPLVIDGKKISTLGQGSGMLGLPGDFTPPSRFVRAVAFSKSALPVETASEGVLQAFHLLNQFDIPRGASRDAHGNPASCDYTLWTAASDTQNLCFYFRTYDNSHIRVVNLHDVDLNAKHIKTISMAGGEQIQNVSAEAK